MTNSLNSFVYGKRFWTVLLGLGLIAVAITLFLRSSASDSDFSGTDAPVTPSEEQISSSTHPPIESQAAPLSTQEAGPSTALKGSALAEYDNRLSALTQTIHTGHEAAAETKQQIPVLLESADPMDQVAGLALASGLDPLDPERDYATYQPEVVLAAVDLCAAEFNETAAQSLLEVWMEDMGGPQTAAEMAHTLLLEARLPYGGGSTALELMIGVNDPQAIFVGLYEFAVNSRLPDPVRTEALVRLRDHVEPEAYTTYVRECIELAKENGDEWAAQAEQLQE